MAIFSRAWKSSKKPRKQRNYRLNAPANIKGKFLGAALSKELRKKYGVRTIRVRAGDSVRVARGSYKKKTGKVESVDIQGGKIMVSGVYRMKKEGSKALIPIEPSNVVITELASDKKRKITKVKKSGKATS